LARYLSLSLCALLLVGCAARTPGGAHPEAAPEWSQQSTITQSEPKSIAEQMAGKEGIVELIMTDTRFEPPTLHAKAGQVVRIHLRNQGRLTHNFVLGRFSIATSRMAPGSENYVEFTATATGDWPFGSDAPGKIEPGLTGTLHVE
jgi:uncharacterized cupredoxin-like copper-binding protein